MIPNLRITSLIAEVDRWTGFSSAFTHLHSGAPADDRRIVLTAVLADATNLGPTRMAEACSVASYTQLAWTAAWHLRGDGGYGIQPLGTICGERYANEGAAGSLRIWGRS